METYYHINKENDCNWKIGDEIHFGRKDNYYWRSLSEKGDFVTLNGREYKADLVARQAFKYYKREELPPDEMKGYHFNPLGTLKETLDSLSNSLKINRELIFEAVRKEYYPQLPSRLKGVWLIPNDEKSLKFWTGVIPCNQSKIFRVVIDGETHRSPQKWLIGGTISVNEWNKFAHNYWKGEDSGSFEDEVLFEGKMKIIEEITLPTKG